jgi:putative membrane protein
MRRLFPWRIAFILGVLFARRAMAHEEAAENYEELWHSWVFEPGIVIPLLLSGWLYVQGVWRSPRVRWRELLCFAGGWLALVVALVSPLHPWGRALFSAHMAQHEILMLVAAPLIVLGRPIVVFLKALPASWANRLARISNLWWWQKIWGFLASALVAWMIHAAILWLWHAPVLMDAVLDNEWVHALQHLSFFLSALLFWWAVIYGRQRALGYGMAVLYMFTTALHSGLLGVLLATTSTLWYPPYAQTTQSWGMTPVEDQQLGGLIMWIPAGVVYIVAGLALLAAWLRESEARINHKRPPVKALGKALGSTLLIFLFVGCDRAGDENYARAQTGGDVQKGHDKIVLYGCASCHTIPGIHGPDAHVGPPLDHIASRLYIGVGLYNNPPNMIQWIQHPRDIDPKAAMPNLHIAEADARDMACYLYTLK